MKGRKKTQKGITLIALIITIVVLLILAAVAISSITNDGILQYAQNSGSKYNQSVANEQETLKEYTNYLENAGSGNGSTGGTTYTAYTVGQEVTIGSESFYVMADSSETEEMVLLLTKEKIDKTNLVQSSSSDDNEEFSETAYWYTEGIDLEYPYDLTETGVPDASHYAAKAAYDYGAKLGGKGRLMTYTEANALKDTHSVMIYGTHEQNYGGTRPFNYFLSTAASATNVMYVDGLNEVLQGVTIDGGYDYFCGVRPVVEISKSKIS